MVVRCWYNNSEVMEMAELKKITVTLSPVVMEKLDKMCEEKGIKRPAVISIALDKMWKEEHTD